jgi:hypothetical protein
MILGGSSDEQNTSPITSSEQESGGAGGATALAGLGEAEQAAKKTTIPPSVLLLGLVIAVAGGLLYGMRQIGLGVGLDFRLPEIDYPVDAGKAVVVRDERHQKVMNDLETSENILQVPLEELRRNPFRLGADPQEIVAEPGEDPAATAARLAAERERQRQQEINRTLEAIEVNSVLTGSVPLARINGKAVRIGDRVADVFIVRAIYGRTVELEADGKVYRRSMGGD